jgi:adenine phosphoribosyltransferase
VSAVDALRASIRDVPDFPSAGILFRDVTPLLGDPRLLRTSIDALVEPFAGDAITHVAGVESRGFIFGTGAALSLGAGFVPIRKRGKLPAATWSEEYALEYGTDALEVHRDACAPAARVLIVDDVLATGGTLGATIALVEQAGGVVTAVSVVIELAALGGRERIAPHPVHALWTT